MCAAGKYNALTTGNNAASKCNATCRDCTPCPVGSTTCSPCRMDMEFTAKLYLTTAEFNGAMSGKFREAVQAALGTAVSLQDVTVLGTAASAGHARKSETVTVTTKVALKAVSYTHLTLPTICSV